MFIVGLTGGIGSGKSTVAQHFIALGITCIDADSVAREVVQPNEPALSIIVQHFGTDILMPDGSLNRRQLRDKIFTNPTEREWLNELLHPLIRQRMLEQCQQANGPYCILMVPLLFENKLQSLVQRTLVVDVDAATQIRRTMQRDNSTESQVKAIITAQYSRSQRLALADDIISNNDDISATQRNNRVIELHQIYQELASHTE